MIAETFVALFVGHHLGDYWVQTDHDAQAKGGPGREGRVACARHVLTLTITQAITLTAMFVVTGHRPGLFQLLVGLGINAATHYWADRRTTLAGLARLIPGKEKFWALGAPRPGHDDNFCLGTGAAHLDQSWHIGWLFVAALVIGA